MKEGGDSATHPFAQHRSCKCKPIHPNEAQVVPVEELGLRCPSPGQQEGDFTLHSAASAAMPEGSTQPPATAPRSLCLWEMLPL